MFLQIYNLRFICIFSHIFLSQSKNYSTYLLYLDLFIQNHPSFAICWSSGKKKHMSMLINNPISTTLIIYSSKVLSILHRIVNNSAQGQKPNPKAICFLVIFRKSQIRVCNPLTFNNIECIQEWIDYRDTSPLGQFCPQEDQGKTCRKRRSEQVSRINQPVYVLVVQTIDWEIRPRY